MRRSIPLVAALTLTVGLSAAPAQARPDSADESRAAGSWTTGKKLAGQRLATMPAGCGTDITMVYPSTTLVYAQVRGMKGSRWSTNLKLGFMPKTISHARTIESGATTTDFHYAVDSAGRMWQIQAIFTDSSAQLRKKVVSSGWSWVRTMTTHYPYIYAVSTTGHLRRLSIWNSGGVGSVVTLPGGTGHKSVNSLSYGGYWETGSDGINEVQDDIVFSDTTGRLGAYAIPRKTYSKTSRHIFRTAGWNLKHVSAGSCDSGDPRQLVGINAAGEVRVYLDRDQTDQNGSDIAGYGKIATWAGLFQD